jgi:hypothetical protein
VRFDAEYEKNFQASLAEMRNPDWASANARLSAYAAPLVLDA